MCFENKTFSIALIEPISSCSGTERDKGESRREVLMKTNCCAPKKNSYLGGYKTF
jgi:hypothetical protein